MKKIALLTFQVRESQIISALADLKNGMDNAVADQDFLLANEIKMDMNSKSGELERLRATIANLEFLIKADRLRNEAVDDSQVGVVFHFHLGEQSPD